MFLWGTEAVKAYESKDEQEMVQSILNALKEKELVTPRTFDRMKLTERERRLDEASASKVSVADRMELRHMQVKQTRAKREKEMEERRRMQTMRKEARIRALELLQQVLHY